MTPSPIRRVLSTFRRHRVQSLLIGGQACILYGGAEFSRDIDFAVSPDEANLARSGDIESIRQALLQEQELERRKDLAHWQPLRRQLEQWRHERKPEN